MKAILREKKKKALNQTEIVKLFALNSKTFKMFRVHVLMYRYRISRSKK